MAAQRVRRARKPRGDGVSAAAQRADARAASRVDHDCRRVDGVAGRDAAGASRRPRLHLQVEHGVDARHARVRRQRSHLPPLGPQRSDVLAALRVHRKFHPAVLARRGRARQARDARQDAGRHLAEAREPARALRLHVRPPRQEAHVHGLRVRAVARVEPRREPRLASAAIPRASRHPALGARPEPRAGRAAGAAPGRLRPHRLRMDRLQRFRRQRRLVHPARARSVRLRRGGRQLHADTEAGVCHRRARGRPVRRAAEQRLRDLRRQQSRQRRRHSVAADPAHGRPHRLRSCFRRWRV